MGHFKFTRSKLLPYVPFAALSLFVAALGALIWLTRAYDADEQQATLISDTLWIEQNLRFKLDRNEAQLQQIGPELFLADALSPRTQAQLQQQLFGQERGLIRILWLDRHDVLRGASPPRADEADAPADLRTGRLAQFARALGRPAYSGAYAAQPDDDHHIQVHVPIWVGETFLGTVVGVYSLSDLVVRDLPWWFSQRYRVAVLDSNGNEIAAKSTVAPLALERSYTISFDPPGHGLTLQITAYKSEARWIPLLLGASIVVLGVILVWSVWQVRRQLVRRQAAETALRKESAYRKAMEDSLITGLRARALDGTITYVNSAFCRIVGYEAHELLGRKPPMPYWDPEHLERTREIHDQILRGGTPSDGVELPLRRKDGQRIETLIFEAPLIDAEGRHSGWMGSMMDITEQKQARELALQQEERLQATSRLIVMGEMASTLAHELNQPLAAIASYNNGCLNRLAEDSFDRQELRDIHDRIARQARRAGDIIRRVHDFVRRSEPKREQVNLSTVIRESVALLETDIRKRRMLVRTELAGQLPPVAADPVMIEQLIVNLVRNAMDAMRDNPAGRRTVHISTRQNGGQLIVCVADQGTGIPPDAAQRLFEPFFSTKQEGMGMGLNICRSIAELHHGRLGFEANPGGGTIFILSLPVEPL